MEKFRFEDLKVYQKSLDYVDFVYALSEKFPKHEIYSLTSQFRRASNSISLNIGEGESGTTNEYVNFLRISRRSARECVVCTTLARRRQYINEEQEADSRKRLVELSKMLSGLMNSLR
ncbi:MAG TPA: four helix bundle protein [Bacteroidia bacterium]|nr:four helix bundle protein [Bacteroidia bacterium]